MLKKSLIAGAIVATLELGVSGMAFADGAAPPASPATFTGNIGVFSQYVFRGLTQTNEEPAYQGGFDFTYNFGPATFYLGTWGSNINWLLESGQEDSSLEMDLYGGIRGNFGASDFTYDVGYLYYYYPDANSGITLFPTGEKGDTGEIYGQLGYKWFTAKYSYGVSDKYFAVRDAQGTWYLNLTATVPFGSSGFTGTVHWGDQKYNGTDDRLPFTIASGATCTSNDDCYSYTDWLVGISYDVSKLSTVLSGVTFGINYTNTDSKDFYDNFYGRNIGKDQITVYLQKAL